jgi:hypothetical protein
MEKVYSTLAEIETDPVLDEAISRAIQKNQ